MVKKEALVYLFIGQDSFSKDAELKRIKEKFIPAAMKDFNLDILYARSLTLTALQERLLFLPLKSEARVVVVKEAEGLKENIRGFLIDYVKNPLPQVILILDINQQSSRDEFINSLIRYAKVCRFREPARLDTFTLVRQIDSKKAGYALRMLNQLLKDGERPERILGGLRYAWERGITNSSELKRRLRLLLNCDIDIKTGRVKPVFSLERLVIKLSCLEKAPG